MSRKMPLPGSAATALPAGGGPGPTASLRQRLRRLAWRGVLAQFGCLAVALLYSLIGRDAGSFRVNWLYSTAIGTSCWLFIDAGRLLLSALASRRLGRPVDAADGAQRAWLLGSIAFGVPAGYLLGHLFADRLLGLPLRTPLHDWPALAVTLVAAVAASFYFHTGERLRNARLAAESARRIAAEHELRLLASQLEPHMLFNTLANLRVLITLDPPRAQAMLDRLIAFLRAMLGASRVEAHPLADEFARLGDYLELMQVRMGERLHSRLTLPAELERLPVPPFLLQPLVENAIRHGLEPQVAGGRIEVSASLEGLQLVLRVRDTGIGLAPTAMGGGGGSDDRPAGFGLTQVRERLASRYGAAASLQLAPAGDADGGTLATVRLPLGTPVAPA